VQGDFAGGLSDGESTGRDPSAAMLCAERRAATRRISADALDPPPGDFCREVVIVRARFGFALVAQLDRASDFESEGREFESLRARQ
jgi:hypothetical protein